MDNLFKLCVRMCACDLSENQLSEECNYIVFIVQFTQFCITSEGIEGVVSVRVRVWHMYIINPKYLLVAI